MRFLDRKTTWTNKELGWIKLCLASAYLLLGTYFHSFFEDYLLILLLIFVLTSAWTIRIWLDKMGNRKKGV